MFTVPTIADFKTYFNRDFPFGSDLSSIMDEDIQKALDKSSLNFNTALFSIQLDYQIAYLNLSAHFLVLSLRASSQGIAGSYTWLVGSKGVGSVSESYQVPEMISSSPVLAMLSKTSYGAEYLQIILPRLIGGIFTSEGTTKA